MLTVLALKALKIITEATCAYFAFKQKHQEQIVCSTDLTLTHICLTFHFLSKNLL